MKFKAVQIMKELQEGPSYTGHCADLVIIIKEYMRVDTTGYQKV